MGMRPNWPRTSPATALRSCDLRGPSRRSILAESIRPLERSRGAGCGCLTDGRDSLQLLRNVSRGARCSVQSHRRRAQTARSCYSAVWAAGPRPSTKRCVPRGERSTRPKTFVMPPITMKPSFPCPEDTRKSLRSARDFLAVCDARHRVQCDLAACLIRSPLQPHWTNTRCGGGRNVPRPGC